MMWIIDMGFPKWEERRAWFSPGRREEDDAKLNGLRTLREKLRQWIRS